MDMTTTTMLLTTWAAMAIPVTWMTWRTWTTNIMVMGMMNVMDMKTTTATTTMKLESRTTATWMARGRAA